MIRPALAAVTLCAFGKFYAQELQYNSAYILHELQKLPTAATVLYVAAHPDDENTRLISYLVNERHFRTAYLSLTRGEGGQNLLGGEQGAALGVIRTQELHAARTIDGGEQYFSSAPDFGYSKSADETLQKWDRETVLEEIVLVIRKLKPDVIICRFPATGEGGHGHHTASAILALEAFEAAADSARFPEQLKLFTPWKCRRIYWNTFNFSSARTTGPGQFTLDVGGYNAVLGKSYGEIAAQSRSMHKSQGFGSVPHRGETIEYFKLLKGDSIGSDIFDGIPVSLSRFQAFRKAAAQADKCISGFDATQPYRSLPDLIALRRALLSIKPADKTVSHWKKLKLAECERLMVQCAGLWLDASCITPSAVTGSMLHVRVSALNRTPVKVKLHSVLAGDVEVQQNKELSTNQTFTADIDLQVPVTMDPSGPFWNSPAQTVALRDFLVSRYAGKRADAPALEAEFIVSVDDEELIIRQEVVYRKGDPVKGEVVEPLYIVSPVNVNFEHEVYVAPPGQATAARVIVSSNKDSVSGVLRLALPAGWNVKPFDSILFFSRAGENKMIALELQQNGPVGNAGPLEIAAAVFSQARIFNDDVKWISYDHIPRQMMLKKASAQLAAPELKRGIRKVAYIPGAGDEVARCLKQAGYEVATLDNTQAITPDRLRQFDAVVTGIRAFNVNEQLYTKMPVLLDYVESGGNLIVQYNTNSRVGPLAFTPGPLPYSITRKRVTDEFADVRFLAPGHPALNHPNKITKEDFSAWVQERGIYFAEPKDKRYETILSMNDPGEEELTGSLLIAKHGKGNFVYTGLAFFRQLPAGVPGAYRLFANLLALPANE